MDWSNLSVLVTGGTGSFGKRFVDIMLKECKPKRLVVFSRDELLRRAWSKNIKAGHRTVDVHVRRLRQLLEPFECDRFIQTVRGFGYRFVPPAQPALKARAAVTHESASSSNTP